jgi:hypothetical protein
MLAREKALFEIARLERIKDRLQRFVHLERDASRESVHS